MRGGAANQKGLSQCKNRNSPCNRTTAALERTKISRSHCQRHNNYYVLYGVHARRRYGTLTMRSPLTDRCYPD